MTPETLWTILGCVILAPVLLLLLLLIVRVYVTIVWHEEEFSLYIRLFGIPIRVFPFGEKRKKKYRLSHYTLRKIRKRDARAARRAERRRLRKLKRDEKRAAKKAEGEGEEKEPFSIQGAWNTLRSILSTMPPMSDMIPLVCRVIKLFSSKFFGKLHIKVARLHMQVGAEDAMQAAVRFGAINQAVQYLIAFLQSVSHVDGWKRADVAITPDFLSDTIKADLRISLGMSLGNAISAVIKALWYFLVGYMKAKPSAGSPKFSILPPLPPFPVIPGMPDMPDGAPLPDKPDTPDVPDTPDACN